MRSLVVKALVVFLLVGGLGALAVELPRVSVDPMVAWVELEAGISHSGSFEVNNLGARPITLNVAVFDFILGERGAFTTLFPGSLGDRSLAEHMVYSPERMTLEAGASRTVNYSFTLPQEASGPHWATLVVTPESPEEVEMEPEDEAGLGFVVQLEVAYAFTIIQRSPSPPTPAGQVVGIEVRGATADDGTRELTVETAFQNLADDIARCTVYFEVRDPDGTTMARHEVSRERAVLPGALRIFSHTFTALDMPPGEYLILGVVDYGGDALTAGQYLATVRE